MVKFVRFTIISVLFYAASIQAQNISVSATTDTSVYKVGDFIRYDIEIKYDKGIVVYLPSVKDSVKTLDYILHKLQFPPLQLLIRTVAVP